jgi:hypothetical protein
MTMFGFYANAIFGLLILGVLIAAVFSIFDANKRTRELEKRLIDIQEDLQQIKSAIFQQKPKIDTNV